MSTSESYVLPLAKVDRDSEWRLTVFGRYFARVEPRIAALKFRYKTMVLQAKKYLREMYPDSFFQVEMIGLWFVARTFWNIQNYGMSNALSYIAADATTGESYGFDHSLFQNLAALFGVSLP